MTKYNYLLTLLWELTWVKDLTMEISDDRTMNAKPETLEIEALRTRLAQVETELAETLQRMPAHSVKPVFMAALLDLEDERSRLIERIKVLSKGPS